MGIWFRTHEPEAEQESDVGLKSESTFREPEKSVTEDLVQTAETFSAGC